MLLEIDLMMVMKKYLEMPGVGKRAMSPPTKDTSLHTNLFWSARLMRRVGSDICAVHQMADQAPTRGEWPLQQPGYQSAQRT